MAEQPPAKRQATLGRFMVPSPAGRRRLGDEEAAAAAEARRAEQARAAGRVGLPWPRPRTAPRRGAGRTPNRELYKRMLYDLLESEGTLPDDLDTIEPPPGWRPGQGPRSRLSLVGEWVAEAAVAVAAPNLDEDGVEVVEDEVLEVQADVPAEEAGERSRKEPKLVSQEARLWFFEFHALLQQKQPGFPLSETLKAAQLRAPDVFEGVHPHTPYKWKGCRVKKELGTRRGRRCLVNAAVLGDLVELARSVCKDVPLGTTIISEIFSRRLSDLGLDVIVRPRWCARLLQKADFRWRKRSLARKPEPPQEAVEREQRRLALRLEHTAWCAGGVPRCRWVNFDELSCRMLPTGDKGWCPADCTERKAIGDTRLQYTVGLACNADGSKAWAQLIFGGSSSGVLPIGAAPDENIICCRSENHWSSPQTIREMLTLLESSLNPPGQPAAPWILLWDCSPLHYSREARAVLRDFENALPVWVAPGYTASCQPNDVSSNRSFKEGLRKAAGRALALEILASGDVVKSIKSMPVLRNAAPYYVREALQGLKSTTIQNGWRHVVLAEEARDEGITEAVFLHAAGHLYSELPITENMWAEGDLPAWDGVEPSDEDSAHSEEEPEDLVDEDLVAEDIADGDEAQAAQRPVVAAELTVLQRLSYISRIYGPGPPRQPAARGGGAGAADAA